MALLILIGSHCQSTKGNSNSSWETLIDQLRKRGSTRLPPLPLLWEEIESFTILQSLPREEDSRTTKVHPSLSPAPATTTSGLTPPSLVGTEVSLHRDLFLSLPQKPAMPARLEAQDIINGHIPLANPASPALGQGDKFQYLEASMKQSLSISSDIVSSARQTGTPPSLPLSP